MGKSLLMGMRGEYLNPQICPLCHGPSKTGRMCAGCKSRNTEVRVTYLKPAPQPSAPEPGSLTDLEFWRAAGARGPYTYLVQCVLGGPVKVGTAVDRTRDSSSSRPAARTRWASSTFCR